MGQGLKKIASPVLRAKRASPLSQAQIDTPNTPTCMENDECLFNTSPLINKIIKEI